MKRFMMTIAALSLMTTMPSVAQRGGQNENPDAQNPMTVTQGAPRRDPGGTVVGSQRGG